MSRTRSGLKGRTCWLKVRSFDGGVEIGGVYVDDDDEREPVEGLRLLVKSDLDTAVIFQSLKCLVDRFGEYAQDFCEDWAFAVSKEMRGTEFRRKIEKVDYIPIWALPWEQDRVKKGFRLDGKVGVFVFPCDLKEEK